MAERTNPHANLIIGAQDEASPVFDKIKASSQSMAAGVEQAATKAAGAVGGIGDKAAPAAQKLDGITASMIRQVQRLNAELEAGGARNAAYFEKMASVKGADLSAMAPYLADLKKAEAAQRVATTGLDQMGMSAKQTTAALRQVPMQFTDIVVSLQGGQSAMQVFLQQGGQLKDMFGGVGNAAKALGGYVVGLINPFTLAAAAVGGIAVAYMQGSKEADAYRTALITTGNAAGTNAAQLKSYAQEISGIVGTQGKAAESLAALASTGKVGAESLRDAAKAAVEYERAGVQAVGKTAEQFASLRNEPLAAVLKLNEGMNFLTDSTYKQIKSLEEQGKTAEAASVAQRAFADTLAGRAGEMERNLGTVERGWLAVKDAAKSAWDAILNVGRASTSVDQLSDVRKQIAARENQLANDGFGSNGGGAAFGRPSSANSARLSAELTALKAQAAALEGVAFASKTAAEAERQRSESVKASAAFDKAGERFLTDKVKMERELAVARTQGAEAGRSQAEIEKRLGEIRASYAKKGGGGVAAENKELRDQQRIFAELAGVSSTYYAELANAQKQRAAGVITEQQYVTAVQSLIEKQPFAVALAKEEAAAAKALSKAYAEAAAERIKTIQSMERAADSLQSQNDALREEIELIGLSTEQQTLVLQQRNDVIILTKEATLAELERQSAITGTQTRVEIALASEIEALKERNALLGAKGVKNAAVDAAKTAKDEWQKTTDSINQSLTDALMRGFESGKDFAKNLGDTVVNMFKTMVLRPVISAVVNPVAGAAAGALGFSGTANAATAPSGVGMLNTGINSAVQGTFSKFALSETGKSLGLSMAGPDASGYNMLSGTGQQMSQALGVVGDTLAGYAMGSMARSLISNGYSAGKGMDNFQKAGIAVGSALGGPVAGAIIGAGAGAFNQLFGRKLKDSGIQGTFGGTEGFDGERYDFYKGGVFRSDKTKTSPLDQDTTDALTQQFRAIQLSTGLMAETLGLASGSVASFTKDIKLSFKGLTEEQIQEKMAAEFTAISDEMAGQVLGTAQSEYAKANETASQTLNRLATSLITVNSAFELLGVAMLDASLASGDMASRLMEQSGGGEAFAANLGTYYDNFYDQAEKTAYVTGQVTAALASVGLQMPKTREEFRALVESQIALGDSGTQAVAALLGVSGAFASVVPVLSEAMKRLQSDTAGLQIELLRAQGNTTGADAAQRTLDTTGFTEAEVALYDYNTALRAQIGALDAATEAAAQQAEIRAGFERQLLELQGDTAALRALDIAGMDAYNVSLFDQVRVTEAAAQAEQELAAKRAQIAQERYGLETQLLQLQGNTTALRARELELIDPSSRALQEQIWSMEDEKRIAEERTSLQDTLNQLTLTSVELRALEIAKLDESNRPLQERIWLLEDEKRIAEERNGLMSSLYQSLGNTGALRAEELAKLDPANRALQEQVWQIDDAKAALEKALQAESASAQAGQQAAQERVNTLKSIFDTLKSNVDSLYGSVEATKVWSAAQANAFIDNALGNARATGYMPEADDLADAISGARGGLDKPYATEFEKQRDTLVLAGKLAELQDISGGQLTIAERQLKAAEDQVDGLSGLRKQGQDLLDSLSGNTTATLSIVDAIAGLSAAVLAVISGGKAVAGSGGGAVSGGYGGGGGGIVTGMGGPSDFSASAGFAQGTAGSAAAMAASAINPYGTSYANDYNASTFFNGHSLNNLGVDINVLTGSTGGPGRLGNVDMLYGAAQNLGWSSADIANAYSQIGYGISQQEILDRAAQQGIPAFAVGTNYVPRDMLAQIHEGEAIIPRAYNPAAGGGMQSNARLELLIEGLTNRVAALQTELVAIKTNTGQMAENIDEVTEGGNAIRSRSVGATA